MKKKAIAQIGFEFLSVVFAVLLALGLNSYKQGLDFENESNLLRERIITEVIANKARLDSVIIRNENTMDYLDSLSQLESFGGFAFEVADDLVLQSAWTFTQASKAFSYMDPEFLTQAAQVYEVQSYYRDANDQSLTYLGDIMLKVSELEEHDLLNACQFYLMNLLEVSHELQDNYRDFLDTFAPDHK